MSDPTSDVRLIVNTRHNPWESTRLLSRALISQTNMAKRKAGEYEIVIKRVKVEVRDEQRKDEKQASSASRATAEKVTTKEQDEHEEVSYI